MATAKGAPAGKRLYTRSMAEELGYLCRHLKRDEAQIVAVALRRGVFETFKSLVIKQCAANQITRKQAEALLGRKVFDKVSTWIPETRP